MSPGTSPAEVSFGGDLVLGSRTLIELGGTTKRSQYDELDVTGLASLGGTLDVLLIDGFPPAPGDTFEIITAASILGTFVAESLPTLPGSLEWFVNYSGTSVELFSAFAGDFDFDGDVDGDDLAVWGNQYGTVAPLVAAASASTAVKSFSTEPVGESLPTNSDLVDVALAVALAEEADWVFGKRKFVAHSPPLEFFSAEPSRRSDFVASPGISSSAAVSTTDSQGVFQTS